jgi:hypothetical protein
MLNSQPTPQLNLQVKCVWFIQITKWFRFIQLIVQQISEKLGLHSVSYSDRTLVAEWCCVIQGVHRYSTVSVVTWKLVSASLSYGPSMY